jgi:hypothetical protein
MRKFSALGWCLLIAVFAFYRPGPALAQAVTGTCGAVLVDCVTSDTTFIPTDARVSVSSTGVTSAVCVGTTANKPGIAVTCDGEKVNGANGDTTPAHPCTMMLGATSVGVDDWHETISTSGSVKLTCVAGAPDPK